MVQSQEQRLKIGEVAARAGVSVDTVRYYEQRGILPPPVRLPSGYRTYGPKEVQILRFVRRARDLGFPMEKVADLLALWRDRSRASSDVKHLAEAQVKALEDRIREMQEMKVALQHLVHSCHGDDRPDCPILDDLGGTVAANHCATSTN